MTVSGMSSQLHNAKNTAERSGAQSGGGFCFVFGVNYPPLGTIAKVTQRILESGRNTIIVSHRMAQPPKLFMPAVCVVPICMKCLTSQLFISCVVEALRLLRIFTKWCRSIRLRCCIAVTVCMERTISYVPKAGAASVGFLSLSSIVLKCIDSDPVAEQSHGIE